jgi:ATP adenylyltransferase
MTDRFEHLWSPHRMVYLRGEGRPASAESHDCPFCIAPTLTDEVGLIVHRSEHSYVVMNLYPYNAGHVLVCPLRHVADYTELTIGERDEIAQLTQDAMAVIREVSGAQGFNIGMNQGGIAGAGIAAHLHQHVVPRWGGDTNFMPVVGQTKVMPELLEETRRLFAEAWPNA